MAEPLPPAPLTATPTEQELSFAAIVQRLETIAGQLESDDVQLEDALRLFEEGVSLSKRGTQRLDAAERRLEVLLDQDRIEPLTPEAP